MAITAYFILLFSFFAAVTCACGAGVQLLRGGERGLIWLERGHKAVSLGLTASSGILIAAFALCDFSLIYVAEHSSLALPLPYRLAAFWAGQEGSLLFWTLAAALICLIFQHSYAYKRLGGNTRFLFWALHFISLAFFLLLLIVWSNPFSTFPSPPADGEGLNPILRHPAMILHPPLLFIGYAGLLIPACLAVAQSFTKRKDAEAAWVLLSRPYALAAWIALSLGIILGAWWSYMELGWGGYWAWDPVENASLVPWLLCTAFVHSAALERRRQILSRSNVLLAVLTFTSTLVATWLTRGGAADSLHSFGQSPVGTPLLWAVSAGVILALGAAFCARGGSSAEQRNHHPEKLPPILSRDGLTQLGVWLLVALALIILSATLSPSISGLISARPFSLTPDFYNRACPPLFIGLTALIFAAFLRDPHGAFPLKRFIFWLLILGVPIAIALGPSQPLSALAALFCIAILALPVTRLSKKLGDKNLNRLNFSTYAIHMGFALMVLGVAISGPYKLETTVALAPGEQTTLGGYAFTLKADNFISNEAAPDAAQNVEILVTDRSNQPLGELKPSLVIHQQTGMRTSEAATLSSLREDIYAALQGRAGNKNILLLSIHPFINWLWIGGALLCLAALVRLVILGRGTSRGCAP